MEKQAGKALPGVPPFNSLLKGRGHAGSQSLGEKPQTLRSQNGGKEAGSNLEEEEKGINKLDLKYPLGD